MPNQSIRVYYQSLQGNVGRNFDINGFDPPIRDDSCVVVTACEFGPAPVAADEYERFVGDASISVLNVAPHGDPPGVSFRLYIDWDNPLPVAVDITLLDTAYGGPSFAE